MAAVNILISARNQATSAFAAIRAQMAHLAANARIAANRMTNNFIQAGGAAGVLSRAVAALNNRIQGLRNASLAAAAAVGGALVRAINRAQDAAGELASALAKMAIQMAAKAAAGAVVFLAAIVPLIVALAELTGLIQLLAPAAIAVGTSILTLKMGFHGVSDALKAGLSGDVDKFKEALKKLSPQAAGTVKALVEIGKSWRNIRKVVQDKLFHNMGRELLDTNSALQPLAAKWLPLISEGFNRAAAGLGALLRESAASGQLDKIMEGVETAITGILGSITPLSQAFLDIAEVAAPSLAETGQGIAGLAERFAAWIRQLKDNGALAEWLERAKSTFADIRSAIKTAFNFIREDVVPAVAAAQEKFEAWKAKILEIKDAMEPMIDFVVGAFKDMKKAFDDNREGIGKLGDLIKILILPVLGLFAVQVGAVVVAFTGLMMVLNFLGHAWEALKSAAVFAIRTILDALGWLINGAAKAFGWIPGLGPQLQRSADDFNKFRDRVNAALDGIRDKTVNVTIRYREVGRSVAVGPSNEQAHTGGRAHGGIAGGLTMVGERGMELVRLPQGSQVYSSEDTQRMLGGSGGGRGMAVHLTVAAARGGVGDPFAEAFLSLLRTGRLQLRAGGDPVLAARV